MEWVLFITVLVNSLYHYISAEIRFLVLNRFGWTSTEQDGNDDKELNVVYHCNNPILFSVNF